MERGDPSGGLAPLIEYAWKAVGAAGRISVVDCSIAGSHFERTLRTPGVLDMLEALRTDGIAVELISLRDFKVDPVMLRDDVHFAGRSWNLGMVVRRELPGDPRGYTVVDLRWASYFEQDGLDLSRLRHNFNNSEREPQNITDPVGIATVCPTRSSRPICSSPC